MPSPEGISDSVGSLFSGMVGGGSQKFLLYVGYFLIAGTILGIGAIIYYWTMYKYKLTIMEGHLTRNNEGKLIFHTRMIKKDRAMPIKDNGIEKWRLLFKFKEKINPVDYKYIQPGNHVFLYTTGPHTYNPVGITGGNPSANFNVDPFDRAFLNLGVQNDAREYMEDGAMKKAQIWMFVSGIIILAAIVVTGWLILKYSSVTAGEIKEATGLLRGITTQVAPQ